MVVGVVPASSGGYTLRIAFAEQVINAPVFVNTQILDGRFNANRLHRGASLKLLYCHHVARH